MQVFPNPSSDGIFHLTVSGNGDTFKYIIVNSIQGKKVYEENFHLAAGSHRIPLHLNFESGIYYLKAATADGSKVIRFMMNSK